MSLHYLLISIVFSAAVITGLAAFFLQAPFFKPLPNIVPFSIAAATGMAITQWGHIALYMRKNADAKRLKDLLGLKTKLPLKQYLIWVPALILISGALFAVTLPISALLREHVFFWIPDMLASNLNSYTEPAVWLAFGCSFIFISVLLPISEEVFFRGFLLPRMAWMGKAAVPVNVLLFACYHFWSPWMIITRFVACLPLYYIVKKKDSLMLAIVAHCMINFISDVLGGVVVYLMK